MSGPDSLPLSEQLIEIIPSLRAFARSLVNNPSRADDLVQECLARALANLEKFEPGTNLRAWLFTILRNHYYSEVRKRRREVEDVDGSYAEGLSSPAGQIDALHMHDFRNALSKLPGEQREALMLVGASGFAYEEAAEICGCAVGTVKSRVNRGRQRLSELLGRDTTEGLTGEAKVRGPAEAMVPPAAGR